MSRALAVFDLDGVLADVRHRLHYVQRAPKDWAAFFAAAGADQPLGEGIALVRELAQDCDVVFLTGRPERYRAETEQWLIQHGLPSGPLHMRADADHRPARIVKPALLAQLAGGRAVKVVVDDDPAVCAALAERGWPARQAEWMGDAPQLFAAQEHDGAT